MKDHPAATNAFNAEIAVIDSVPRMLSELSRGPTSDRFAIRSDNPSVVGLPEMWFLGRVHLDGNRVNQDLTQIV